MKVGKRLTIEQRVQVACYHSFGSKHPLWVVNQHGPGVICSLCHNPSPDVVLRICADCGDEFVIKRSDPNWAPKMVELSGGRLIERTVYCTTCY